MPSNYYNYILIYGLSKRPLYGRVLLELGTNREVKQSESTEEISGDRGASDMGVPSKSSVDVNECSRIFITS
jgi:hypothetical protein